MKKTVSLWLMLCLVGAAAMAYAQAILKDERPVALMSNGRVSYLAGTAYVYRLGADGEAAPLCPAAGWMNGYFTDDRGELFAMNHRASVQKWNGDGFAFICQARLGDLFLRDVTPVAVNGKAYAVALENAYSDAQWLIRIDLADGACQRLSKGAFDKLLPYRENELLVQISEPDGKVVFASYDTVSGQLETQARAEAGARLLCYEAEKDAIYYASLGQIKRIRFGETQTVGYVPNGLMGANLSAALIKDGQMLLCLPGEAADMTAVQDNPAPRQLLTYRAKSLSPVFAAALEAFSKDFPNVLLVSLDQARLTAAQAAEMLINQDGSADLFEVEVSSGLFALKQKGYYVDLSRSPAIAKAVLTYYPSIRAVLSDGDAIVGLPVMLYPYAWAVNAGLWERLDLPPLPKTYLDFMALVTAWRLDEEKPENYRLTESALDAKTLMREMLRMYILENEQAGAPLCFDTEGFRQAAQDIARMPEGETEDRDSDSFLNKPILLTAAPQPMGDTQVSGFPSELILPPGLSGEGRVYGQMRLLIVNPFSANQDMAITLLEYLADHMNDVLSIQLSPENNTPLPDTAQKETVAYFTAQAEALAAQLQKTTDADEKQALDTAIQNVQAVLQSLSSRYLVSPEAILAYRRIAPYLVFGEESLYLGYADGAPLEALLKVADRFLLHQLTLDQMVAELDRIARAVYQEARR